jgi:hypothetical protein
VDGEELTTSYYSSGTISSIYDSTADLILGKCTFASRYLDGMLDEIHVWNDHLSDAEINTLYTSYVPASSPATGLVAHLKLDENTGTALDDETANNNDGTQSGCTWISGQDGYGLELDGGTDYAYIPTDSTISGFSSGFTAALWVKFDTPSERTTLCAKYDSTGSQRSYLIEQSGSSDYHLTMLCSSDGTNYKTAYVDWQPSSATWYYITVTWEPSTVPKFYVNGSEVTTGAWNDGTVSSLYDNTGEDLLWGKCAYADRYLDGQLDDLRIYDEALTSSEVSTLYGSFS